MSTPASSAYGPTTTGTGAGGTAGGDSTVPKPPLPSEQQQPPTSSPSKTNNNTTTTTKQVEEEKKMDTDDDNQKDDEKESNSSNIPVTAVAMKLLDIRLKPSSAILKSVIGEFTKQALKSKTQQLVVARSGGVLELYTIAMTSGTQKTPSLKLLRRLETRSILRDITSIRLVGEKRDILAVSSDSGCLSIVDFEFSNNSNVEAMVSVASSYGKSGCRRSTPGQYLASDPKGRAICVAAIEKRKLVYVLNQNSGNTQAAEGNASSTPNKISLLASPLEAHRIRTLCLAMVGIDNGYDNPLFACIEIQYQDTNEMEYDEKRGAYKEEDKPVKQLAYYELDLGLNHVSRKWAIPISSSSYSLQALPGYADGGPSGVLVGSENEVTWYHNTLNSSTNSNSTATAEDGISCQLPQRKWDTNKNIDTLVTQLTIHRQKRNKFFGLCQTEVGDVFKIEFDLNKAGIDGFVMDTTGDDAVAGSGDPCVKSITVTLLDTLPVSNSLNVSKKGLLFCASEFGGYYDHGLYQFERIDIPDAPSMNSKLISTADTVTFTPSSTLQNLLHVDGLDNLCPTTDVLVGELTNGQEVSPQIYTLGGRGPSSCLKTLRHGCSVTELAVSELPGIPGDIFTVAHINNNTGETTTTDGDEETSKKINYSKYIVVSFADATLVLSVGDTVEEVGKESGFNVKAATIACGALRNGSCLQIHQGGVRHILQGQAMEWHVPGLQKIEFASTNTSQVMIALAGGELIYFELDALAGKLSEGPKRLMKADICCLDVGVVSHNNKERSLFCAVGCRDSTIQIISLEPQKEKLLKTLGLTTLKSRPNSVKLLPPDEEEDPNGDLILMVGLDDGSSLRATVDPITGAIGTSPTRRFLGARPVSVSTIPIEGKLSLLLLSSRPWISRSSGGGGGGQGGSTAPGAGGKHIMAPLSYTPLDHGCAFSSEAVPEGVVATSGNTLRILSVNSSGLSNDSDGNEAFNTNKVPLRYTPRHMTLLSTTTSIETTTGEAAADKATTTPKQQRKVVLAVVESDYNDYGLEERKSLGFDPTKKKEKKKDQKATDTDAADGTVKKEEKDDDAMDEDSDEEDDDAMDADEKKAKEGGEGEDDDEDEEDEDGEELRARSTPVRGPIPPRSSSSASGGGGASSSSSSSWGSCLRLVDPSNSCDTLDVIEMPRNEAALCCCSVRFHTRGGESLLAVGSVSNMAFHPIHLTSSHISLYRVVNGERLQLLHKTTIENNSNNTVTALTSQADDKNADSTSHSNNDNVGGPILALAHFQGRLLVGIGRTLRMYEMGKRQLLRKCELKGLPTYIKTLQTAGDRAFLGDMMRSLHIVRYEASANRLILIANDPLPRPIVCQELLDFNTVAVGDKFGNISVLRLPRGAATETVDVTGQRALWDTSSTTKTGLSNSNVAKLETLCHYYIGEVVTSMTRSSLVAGVAESLIYVTATGRIGALVPFQSRDDVEFYSQLEEYLRVEAPRITGRDPQSYRSYYSPVMHVIDGDLCDAYINGGLSAKKQAKIAERLDRSVGEIMKKLEDTRNSLL